MRRCKAQREARRPSAIAGIELLESRLLLSGSHPVKIVAPIHHVKPVLSIKKQMLAVQKSNKKVVKDTLEIKTRAGGVKPAFHTAPTDASNTPASLRHAYGVDQVNFSGIAGDGTGQTIAIVDAFDDPALLNSTDPGFATSDLALFDAQFGLPNPPSFTKVNESGGTALPGIDGSGISWRLEESLDVEWAHAMAPNASIILVEASQATLEDLIGDPNFSTNGAVGYARTIPGVSVVSMSWGAVKSAIGNETAYDSFFTTPAGHAGVTFLASTGDSGTPGDYPAYSPNVVAVGGTTLNLSGGNYSSETAWGGTVSGQGTGGGQSGYEGQPAYQSSITQVKRANGSMVAVTTRTIPDISIDADPSTGVAVYDSYDGTAATPWVQVGGTSVSAPVVGGLIALSDQGRALHGQSSLDGPTQVLPALYSMPSSDYHDITTGTNPSTSDPGYSASAGYDATTGIGTPIANTWVADLAGLPQPAINNLYLKKDGTFLDTWINSATPGQGAATQQLVLSAAHSILFNGETGNDTLTLDYTGGNFTSTFAAGIFNGSIASSNAIDFIGTAGNDTLAVNSTGITPGGGLGSTPISLSNVQTIQLPGGSGGNDAINISGNPAGGYTIDGNTPPTTGTANVSVNLTGTSTAINFASTQYLAGLSISPTDKATLTTSATSGGKLLVTPLLSILGNGILDLANNVMVVQAGSLSAITGLLNTGFANGRWNGAGINSSAAALNSTFTTALGVIANSADGVHPLYSQFDGYNASPTDILVKYTYYGDADLSGTINGADYALIDLGFGTGGLQTGWVHGDFNYDTLINGTDFTLIDNDYNQQGMPL